MLHLATRQARCTLIGVVEARERQVKFGTAGFSQAGSFSLLHHLSAVSSRVESVEGCQWSCSGLSIQPSSLFIHLPTSSSLQQRRSTSSGFCPKRSHRSPHECSSRQCIPSVRLHSTQQALGPSSLCGPVVELRQGTAHNAASRTASSPRSKR